MSKLNCYCGSDCTVIAAVASVIIGIIATVLNVTATIAVGTTVLIAAFAVALFFFAAALIGSAVSHCANRSCKCTALSALIIGVLGTVIAAIVLLLFDLAATGVIASLVVGALSGFFTLVLTSVACLIKCLSGCNEG